MCMCHNGKSSVSPHLSAVAITNSSHYCRCWLESEVTKNPTRQTKCLFSLKLTRSSYPTDVTWWALRVFGRSFVLATLLSFYHLHWGHLAQPEWPLDSWSITNNPDPCYASSSKKHPGCWSFSPYLFYSTSSLLLATLSAADSVLILP